MATEKESIEKELAEIQNKYAKAYKWKGIYKTKLSDSLEKVVEMEKIIEEKGKDLDYLQNYCKKSKETLTRVLAKWPSLDARHSTVSPDLHEIPLTPSPSQVSVIFYI